jgi:hypothetical protein
MQNHPQAHMMRIGLDWTLWMLAISAQLAGRIFKKIAILLKIIIIFLSFCCWSQPVNHVDKHKLHNQLVETAVRV